MFRSGSGIAVIRRLRLRSRRWAHFEAMLVRCGRGVSEPRRKRLENALTAEGEVGTRVKVRNVVR